MICRRCLLRLSTRRNAPTSTSRNISNSAKSSAQAITSDTVSEYAPHSHGAPAATSTSAAQPFSAGTIPGIEPEAIRTHAKKERVKSSVPAGTVLKGLSFLKGAQDPVALEDEAYPEWLWSALERKSGGDEGEDKEGDLFGKSLIP